MMWPQPHDWSPKTQPPIHNSSVNNQRYQNANQGSSNIVPYAIVIGATLLVCLLIPLCVWLDSCRTNHNAEMEQASGDNHSQRAWLMTRSMEVELWFYQEADILFPIFVPYVFHNSRLERRLFGHRTLHANMYFMQRACNFGAKNTHCVHAVVRNF